MNRRQGGFTIIEVLIILAIATLIVLVVLMAVPAFQRASRNAQRTHDAELLIAQRAQYNINTGTSIPASPGGFDCSSPLTTKQFCQFIDGQLTYYDMAAVTFHNSGTTAPTVVPTVTDPDVIVTDTYFQCAPDGSTAIVAANPRYMVVLFALEKAGTVQQRCIESYLYPH